MNFAGMFNRDDITEDVEVKKKARKRQ